MPSDRDKASENPYRIDVNRVLRRKAQPWQFGLQGMLKAFIVIGVVALVIRVCYRIGGPAMPLHVMRQVEEGMSESEVLQILGEPEDKGERQWHYHRRWNAGWVEIHFDGNGSVLHLNDESALGSSL